MVDSSIGQGLTSHCHAWNNLPETWASINQTKSFHCYNHHWRIFRIFKFQIPSAVSHINITKTHLLHAIIIILTLQGIVISFMQLNEMVRYSLLHKHIIHTTLLFHRAFLAVSWSWLSYNHNNLWNGSWIVLNSSFQFISHP